ncbi:MAG: metal-dependent hydrolase [Balneola sp.]|nr:metal-dependent hydrolase [Balneola sp.]|tara:strand:- start:126349 stop:127077 length:729 start_codon:yes stop_codon:yes gene_type:complete
MARPKTYSKEKITVAKLDVDVHRKNIKNLNLRVYPSEQKIRLSVPRRTPEKTIIQFLTDKLPWIKKHLQQKRKAPVNRTLNFVSGEKHWVWGQEFELQILEKRQKPSVETNGQILKMTVRPDSETAKKASVLKEWYRAELKREIPKLIEKWEPMMQVSVAEFGVKDMITRWGTCNIRARRIWLNLQLAHKRPELLEYVVVHEMTHLHERLHNKRFYGLMSQFLPNWKALQDELNGKSSMKSC